MEKNHSNIKKITIGILIASIIFILWGLNQNIISLKNFNPDFDNPYAYSKTEDGACLIDKQKKRINFINDKGKVINSIKLGKGTPLQLAENCLVHGDYVYVTGIHNSKKSSGKLINRVVRYSLNGTSPKVVYEITTDIGVSQIWTVLYDIVSADDKIVVAVAPEVYQIDIVDITSENKDILYSYDSKHFPYDVNYNGDLKILTIIDFFGNVQNINFNDNSEETISSEDNSLISFYTVLDNGQPVISDTLKKNFTVGDKVVIDNAYCYWANIIDNEVFFCNNIDNSVYCYNSTTGNLECKTKMNYSVLIYLQSIIFYLCICYVVFFIIFSLVNWIILKIKEEKFGDIRNLINISIVVFGVVAISVFYSLQIYNTKVNFIKSHASYAANLSANNLLSTNSNKLEELLINKESDINEYSEGSKLLKLLEGYFAKFLKTTEGNYEDYLDFCYYYKDNVYVIYDTDYSFQTFTPYDFKYKNFNFDASHFDTAEEYKNEMGDYISSKSPVILNDKTIGFVNYGINITKYKNAILVQCLELIMKLLVGVAAFYMFYQEAMSAYRTARKKRILKRKGLPISESIYSRQYGFIVFFVCTIDNVIATIALREACLAKGYQGSTITNIVSSLPMILYAGSTIGSFLYSIFIGKISVKKFNAVFSIIMIAGLIGQGIGISELSIPVFIGFRLLFFIGESCLYILVSAVADAADNDSERFENHKQSTWSSVSSGILSGIAAGYIAQYAGNKYVYFLGAFVCVLVIFFGFFIFPKNKIYGISQKAVAAKANSTKKTEEQREETKRIFKYIFSPGIVTYLLFLVLPLAIIKNYKTILFPLFSSNLDLPKVYIANLYIFARTLNMLLNGRVKKNSENVSYERTAMLYLILTSVCFLGFAINDSIVWAVIMIVITDTYVKQANPVHKMIANVRAEKYGVNRQKIKGIMEIITSVICCLQSPLLAGCLFFGTNTGCILVGLFCLACGILYGLLNIRKKKSPAPGSDS